MQEIHEMTLDQIELFMDAGNRADKIRFNQDVWSCRIGTNASEEQLKEIIGE